MHNSTPRYYPSQPALADLGRVSGSVAAVFEYVKGAARKLSELWESAATIAAKLGYSKRAVQEAIKKLIELGYLAYRTDYGLRTRRAIIMLWRVESKSSESAPQSSESQAKPSEPDHVADTVELHPDPMPATKPAAPQAEAPRAAEETPAVADPVEAVEVTKTGRKATREEVAKLIEDASRLRGADPKLIKRLAKEHGLSTVRACVKHALANGKKSVGWLFKVLPDWSKNGVPEYAQIKEPKYTPEEARRITREEAERLLACMTPLTEKEIDDHWDQILKSNAWYMDKVMPKWEGV